jgi:hypothetical protein
MLRGLGFAFPSAIPVFPASNFQFSRRQFFPSQKFLRKNPSKSPCFPTLKNIFDFSFDSSPHLTYRHLMQHALLTAVADSTATGLPVTITLPSLDAIDAAVSFLKQRFVDVDYDRIGCSVTIFGDDQRIEGDEDEGLWVLNLVIAPVPFVDTNAI